jgi:hypothetical protein
MRSHPYAGHALAPVADDINMTIHIVLHLRNRRTSMAVVDWADQRANLWAPVQNKVATWNEQVGTTRRVIRHLHS